MKEKNQFCSNCHFWMETTPKGELSETKQIGYCRGNPPQPFYDRSGTPKIARFPIVLGHMWCGLWDGKD